MDFFDILLAKKLEDDRDPKVEGLSVTANGTYSEDGVVYKPVVVNVPETPLATLNATENRTYTAPAGTGYNEVNVNVPLPSNAYLLKELSNLPQPIASFSDGADEVLSSLKVGFDASTNKALMVVSNSNTKIEDNTPYVYRESPNAEKVALDVIGGTVAWNQLVHKSTTTSKTENDVTFTNNNDGTISVSGTATAQTDFIIDGVWKWAYAIGNHKGLWLINGFVNGCQLYNGDTGYFLTGGDYGITPTSKVVVNTVLNWDWNSPLILRIKRGASVSTKISVMYIDLTQAFGSTIADYIYSLEQNTAGSGIAWLKSYGFLTKDYYAYDSGSLQSVNVSARKVYDSNDTLVATYPLDSDLTLRGIPKLDANNKLYYDGDTYESDGGVKRKYGVVDLGTLTWTYNSSAKTFYVRIDTSKQISTSEIANCICTKYVTISNDSQASDVALDKNISIGYATSNNWINIRDLSYTDAATFKTTMNGVYLVYELATPTSETADAYENPQLVGSTEEFVDYAESQGTRDVAIPCGEKSIYFDGNGYLSYFDRTAQVGDTYDYITGKLRSNNVDYQEDSFAIRPMPSGTTYLSASTGDVEELKYFTRATS